MGSAVGFSFVGSFGDGWKVRVGWGGRLLKRRLTVSEGAIIPLDRCFGSDELNRMEKESSELYPEPPTSVGVPNDEDSLTGELVGVFLGVIVGDSRLQRRVEAKYFGFATSVKLGHANRLLERGLFMPKPRNMGV